MSSEAKLDSAALAAQAAETKARIIAYWDSKINEEDGSFEAVFGDPTKTPCTFYFCSACRVFALPITLRYELDWF